MKGNLTLVLALAAGLLLAAGCNRSASRPAQDRATGAVEGVVAVSGAASLPTAIHIPPHSPCERLRRRNRSPRQDRMHLRNVPPVFLWIRHASGHRAVTPPRQQTVLTQLNCRFRPTILGVMAGRPVDFTNSDPMSTTIRVAPQKSGNPAASLTLPPRRPGQVRVFRKPELMIPVTSPGHPWMRAWINVVSNPFYTVSGSQGRFILRGLPSGTYTLAALRPGCPVQAQSITIKPGVVTRARFTFSAVSSTASQQHKK